MPMKNKSRKTNFTKPRQSVIPDLVEDARRREWTLLRVLFSLGACLTGTWATGSLIALVGFTVTKQANICHIPFYGWALTWPIWMLVPTPQSESFFRWTLSLCR